MPRSPADGHGGGEGQHVHHHRDRARLLGEGQRAGQAPVESESGRGSAGRRCARRPCCPPPCARSQPGCEVSWTQCGCASDGRQRQVGGEQLGDAAVRVGDRPGVAARRRNQVVVEGGFPHTAVRAPRSGDPPRRCALTGCWSRSTSMPASAGSAARLGRMRALPEQLGEQRAGRGADGRQVGAAGHQPVRPVGMRRAQLPRFQQPAIGRRVPADRRVRPERHLHHAELRAGPAVPHAVRTVGRRLRG